MAEFTTNYTENIFSEYFQNLIKFPLYRIYLSLKFHELRA